MKGKPGEKEDQQVQNSESTGLKPVFLYLKNSWKYLLMGFEMLIMGWS